MKKNIFITWKYLRKMMLNRREKKKDKNNLCKIKNMAMRPFSFLLCLTFHIKIEDKFFFFFFLCHKLIICCIFEHNKRNVNVNTKKKKEKRSISIEWWWWCLFIRINVCYFQMSCNTNNLVRKYLCACIKVNLIEYFFF